MVQGQEGWIGELFLSLRSAWNCMLLDQGARGNSQKMGARVFENKQNTTGARGGVRPRGSLLFVLWGSVYELLFSGNAKAPACGGPRVAAIFRAQRGSFPLM